MNIESSLSDLGLNKSEIKMYLYLVEKGPSIIQNVSRETFITRSNCYYVVRLLLNKGLVKKTIIRNRTAFETTGEDGILKFVDKMAETANIAAEQLKSLKNDEANEVVTKTINEPDKCIEYIDLLNNQQNTILIGQIPQADSIIYPLYLSIIQSQIMPNSCRFIEKSLGDQYLLFTDDKLVLVEIGPKPSIQEIRSDHLAKAMRKSFL